MFQRAIEKQINMYLQNSDEKTLFIWGPRRSGKTTLLDKFARRLAVKKYNFDFASDREKFAPRREILEHIVRENRIVLIDEIQNYPEATVMIKLLHDEFHTKVIATGSSELRQKTKQFDTLAGRYTQLYCLPLSMHEIFENQTPNADDQQEFINQMATTLQIFGAYPEIYTKTEASEKDRIDTLQNIVDAYVLKDIVTIYELKDQKLAKDILTKIALQLGSEVSVREIAKSLGAYPSTVSNYIEIFIKNYILIPLPSFKTNLRRAVSENRKLYFYDLGIRNMLIRDFRDLDLRPDKGGVFENFIIAEIEKQKKLTNANVTSYFYREYGGKEIDIVLEDYKKNYITMEIKTDRGKVRNIFPLPNKPYIVNSLNYFEKISDIVHE